VTGPDSLLPLIKLAAAFIIMLLAIRFRVNLGLSIISGGAAVGLFFGLAPDMWLPTVFTGLTSPQTLMLAAIVLLILLLSDVLEKSGQTLRLMDALSGYLKNPRLRLVFFPMLIGLLPMPGGAVFSAPMIGAVASRMQVSKDTLAALNYWYRHVWETWWPLYPGIILAASLSGIPITTICAFGLPGMAIMLAAGWFFMLRPAVLSLPPATVQTDSTVTASTPKAVLRQGLPLLVAIGGSVLLETVLAFSAQGIPFESGVIAALAAGILTAAVQNKGSAGILAASLRHRHLWQMVLVIAAIFVFKEMLNTTGAVHQLAQLAGGRTALTVSCIFMPFIVGAVSGITMAYVGATFPLIVSLAVQAGLQDSLTAYVMLAIFSGFTGIMATPLHVCFVLTCQYFHCTLSKAWRHVALPCLLLFCSGLVYHGLLLLWLKP